MIMMMIVTMMRTLKSIIRVITVMVISKAFFKLENQYTKRKTESYIFSGFGVSISPG